MERKIYSNYAFDEDKKEKSKMNKEICRELRTKYKVGRKSNLFGINEKILNDESFDVIIGVICNGYYADYIIYKNKPNLTNDELALLCNYGCLGFGYKVETVCKNKKLLRMLYTEDEPNGTEFEYFFGENKESYIYKPDYEDLLNEMSDFFAKVYDMDKKSAKAIIKDFRLEYPFFGCDTMYMIFRERVYREKAIKEWEKSVKGGTQK